MAATTATGWYRIWGKDHVAHGPVQLHELEARIQAREIIPETWILSMPAEEWSRAGALEELRGHFQTSGSGPTAVSSAGQDSGVSEETAMFARQPSSLRKVRIFADFSDDELSRFVKFMEVLRVPEACEVVKQGQHGDAVYFVLEGELRVRMFVSKKEATLVTLGPGEFFGEISLFDHGPRSADVVANVRSLLLKISADSFETLLREAPELAAPFLYQMGKTLTERIRSDNKRYRDSIQFARTAGG